MVYKSFFFPVLFLKVINHYLYWKIVQMEGEKNIYIASDVPNQLSFYSLLELGPVLISIYIYIYIYI